MFAEEIGIVGATGAVGREMVNLLARAGYTRLRLFASQRSVGQRHLVDDCSFNVELLEAASFVGLQYVLFAVSSDIAREWVPVALSAGAVVIDNSASFRMDSAVPLIIPEINTHVLNGRQSLIANPNCSTIIALMALAPLHRRFGLTRLRVTTYQAASGLGVPGMAELEAQLHAYAYGETLPTPMAFPKNLANNVFPQVGDFEEAGYTGEEVKMRQESIKILEIPKLRVAATCVRVPVLRAHSIAVFAEFERSVDLQAATEALRAAPGIRLWPDDDYPTPMDCSGRVECGVGRLRLDTASENGLAFWCVGDQLLKGAAANAVQILELLLCGKIT